MPNQLKKLTVPEQLVHKKWLSRYTQLAQRYGSKAGQLRPLNEITSQHLPKMMRFKVYGTGTVGHLCRSDYEHARPDEANFSNEAGTAA